MTSISFYTYISALLIIILIRIAYSEWQSSRYMLNCPWIGLDGRIILRTYRARVENIKNFKKAIQYAYQKYSLNDQTFVLPTLADDLIILPPSHVDWIINQPEHILSSEQPHIDSLQSDLTFPHPRIIREPVHHHVINRDLTRQLGNLTEAIADEAKHAVHLFLPKDGTNFKDVPIFPTMMRTIARTSNRVFVGAPLCRNEEYLSCISGFTREVPACAAQLKSLPTFARPLASRYILRTNRRHIQAYNSILTPEIVQRQAALHDTEKASKADFNDALQWLINRGEEVGGIENDPTIIAGRLMALNFASIHTSTFTITNTILDLVASDPNSNYIEELREEVTRVLEEEKGQWTKTGLARMYKLDSALRESLRLGSFQGPGLIRKVMLKGGITSPNGTHCPYGSKIAIASTAIHHDQSLYPPPFDTVNTTTDDLYITYDPFRFARQRTPTQSPFPSPASSTSSLPATYIQKANLAFVSTSSTYHPFGHGKHCCPGRFFASMALKILLATILLEYDFETLESRPKNIWRGTNYVPPVTALVRVKRRVV